MLNFIINLVIWLTILSLDAPKLIANPQCRYHRSRLSGLKVWLNYGFEGDDSELTTDEKLKKYEERIRKMWESLGFHMKLGFCEAGDAVTFVGYVALCDDHGPRDDVVMPELLRNIASSAWTCSHLAATRTGCHQIGAEAYAARACAFLETCKPVGKLFRGYALGHHQLGACLTSSNREVQMRFTGEYVPDKVFNLGEMMQDAEDHSLWCEDTEDAYIQLIDCQCGGVSDLLDIAAMMAVDGPVDPFDKTTARYFIPQAWRTDPDVITPVFDNIEQQGEDETRCITRCLRRTDSKFVTGW